MAHLDDVQLREAIIRLGPWHHDIEVRDGITTRVSQDAEYDGAFGKVTLLDDRQEFVRRMTRVYPDGLEGRSVLDCSCNCGECLFWAKEIGAGRCYGSDVREHWIDQARFLLDHRQGPKDEIEVEVRDLYELPELGLEPFDIALFHGVFYHLPDPIRGLKIAADLAKELLIVTTSTVAGLPDGLLKVREEHTEGALLGVHGTHMLPSGPKTITSILDWLGFPATRLLHWRKDVRNGRGRLGLIAGRDETTFEAFDARETRREERAGAGISAPGAPSQTAIEHDPA
jgi:2-polyprenyl-3-methyl-5-hydroxy-6-metoxy-1,4-benzoquinol methylase